jgi:hypothetical protein
LLENTCALKKTLLVQGGNMKKHMFTTVFALMLCTVFLCGPALSSQVITTKVTGAPTIDGSEKDDVWSAARTVTVKDVTTDSDVTLKSVYTEDMIFFLVSFPDSREDRFHKPWVWDKEFGAYKLGPQREDTFTFKWNMTDGVEDISNYSDKDYTTDVWYWKAGRTDPAGYSDDKMHVLAPNPGKKAKELISRSGKKRYLMRLGDAGKPAQKKRILTDYQGDVENQYESAVPDGSRADIKTRGVWKDGRWTVEFGRKLNTGHADDIQLDSASGKKYHFGISIHGLYGEAIDKTKPHLYGQGRISESLYLVFK